MGLSRKQLRFCSEYVLDLNATNAALRADYSKRTAYSQGSRLLKNVEIQKEIEKLNNKRVKDSGITPEIILKELLRIAHADISQAFDEAGNLKSIHDIPEDVRRVISGVEVFEEYQGQGKNREYIGQTKKIKFWDKTKSLELLGRHLAIFTDKLDHSSRDGSMTPKPVSQVIIMVPSEDA